MLIRFLTRACLAASALCLACGPALLAADKLTIGSDAPALDIEHWVQDGKGKFKPVTKFAPGKVYVVEFWATWCGPCIMSMPHLAETQTKYADKGVQIVSISDEDLETVEKFLEGKVRGGNPADKDAADKPKTYRELTSVYSLTTDPDRSNHEAYMEAAGQNGIPTAFIVGKDQKIEWIGHPMEMDEPLEQIVAGKWDRKKFAEELKQREMMETLMQEVGQLYSKGDIKGALSKVDQALEKVKDGPMAESLQLIKLQLQIRNKGAEDQLPELLSKAYTRYAQQPELINQIAWAVVEAIENGDLKKDKKTIEATLTAMTKAAQAGEGDTKAAAMDTLAHLQFLNGDVQAALKTQTAAIELASAPLKRQLNEFMDVLKEAAKEKSDKEKSDK